MPTPPTYADLKVIAEGRHEAYRLGDLTERYARVIASYEAEADLWRHLLASVDRHSIHGEAYAVAVAHALDQAEDWRCMAERHRGGDDL